MGTCSRFLLLYVHSTSPLLKLLKTLGQRRELVPSSISFFKVWEVSNSCGERNQFVRSQILAKALDGTVGHTGTDEPVSSNAWGKMTTTALPEMVEQQVNL